MLMQEAWLFKQASTQLDFVMCLKLLQNWLVHNTAYDDLLFLEVKKHNEMVKIKL